jgi:hypothetical protein
MKLRVLFFATLLLFGIFPLLATTGVSDQTKLIPNSIHANFIEWSRKGTKESPLYDFSMAPAITTSTTYEINEIFNLRYIGDFINLENGFQSVGNEVMVCSTTVSPSMVTVPAGGAVIPLSFSVSSFESGCSVGGNIGSCNGNFPYSFATNCNIGQSCGGTFGTRFFANTSTSTRTCNVNIAGVPVLVTQPGTSAMISGQITDDSTNHLPVGGVTVTLTGTESRELKTDSNGVYSFNTLTVGGTYTVTPTRSGWTFSPVPPTVNNLTIGGATANFIGTGGLISGTIKDSSPTQQPIPNVSVSLTGTTSNSTLTDGNGNYKFTNLTLGGNYKVTPSHPNYTFNPTRREINPLSSAQPSDFTGVPGYDFTINEFEPVQAVFYPNKDNVQLIRKKSTAVRIQVKVNLLEALRQDTNFQSVKLHVSLLGQNKDFYCQFSDFTYGSGDTGVCTKYVKMDTLDPDTSQPDTQNAQLDISTVGSTETNPDNNTAMRWVHINKPATLKILYVGMYGPKLGRFNTYPAPMNVGNTKTVSDAYIRKTFPLADFGGLVSQDTIPQIPGTFFTTGILGLRFFTYFTDLYTLHRMTDDYVVNKVIGVVHFDYFHKFVKDRCTAGVSNYYNNIRNSINGIIVTDSGTYPVEDCIATETEGELEINKDGHLTARYLAKSFDIPDSDGSIPRAYSAFEDREINNAKSFMGDDSTFLNSNSWIEQANFEALLDKIDLLCQNQIPPTCSPSLGKRDAKIGYSNSGNAINERKKTKKKDFLVIGSIVKQEGISNLPWYITDYSQPTENNSVSYTIRTFDAMGNMISSFPANVGSVVQDRSNLLDNTYPGLFENNQDSGGLLVTKLPLDSNLATVEILYWGKIIARYSVAAKFLRDAIEGIPNSGFAGDSASHRQELLDLTVKIDKQIESGNENEALTILKDELQPKFLTYLKNDYQKEASLQFEKPEILAAADFAVQRLNLQLNQRTLSK